MKCDAPQTLRGAARAGSRTDRICEEFLFWRPKTGALRHDARPILNAHRKCNHIWPRQAGLAVSREIYMGVKMWWRPTQGIRSKRGEMARLTAKL
jgi:hypothetical protein